MTKRTRRASLATHAPPFDLHYAFFTQFPDIAFVIDSHARFIDLNEEAAIEFGAQRDDLVGESLDTVLPPKLVKRLLKFAHRLDADDADTHRRDFTVTLHDKRQSSRHFRVRLINKWHGKTVSIFVVMQDVSAAARLQERLYAKHKHLRELNEQLQDASQHCPLTGLYNRRYFDMALDMELSRLARYPETLSLAMIDIDDFKKVNDQYGHLAGDAVLRSVAEQLRLSTRKTDTLARYGGEEFILMLPHTSTTGAMTVAEKIRDRVARTESHYRDFNVKVTVSIGMTSVNAPVASRNDVIERADAALYEAKTTGKNKTVFFAFS